MKMSTLGSIPHDSHQIGPSSPEDSSKGSVLGLRPTALDKTYNCAKSFVISNTATIADMAHFKKTCISVLPAR